MNLNSWKTWLSRSLSVWGLSQGSKDLSKALTPWKVWELHYCNIVPTNNYFYGINIYNRNGLIEVFVQHAPAYLSLTLWLCTVLLTEGDLRTHSVECKGQIARMQKSCTEQSAIIRKELADSRVQIGAEVKHMVEQMMQLDVPRWEQASRDWWCNFHWSILSAHALQWVCALNNVSEKETICKYVRCKYCFPSAYVDFVLHTMLNFRLTPGSVMLSPQFHDKQRYVMVELVVVVVVVETYIYSYLFLCPIFQEVSL